MTDTRKPATSLRTRFAPSPTGRLHLGHAYAASCIMDFARETGAEVILRIEDTDLSRARPEFEAALLDDLAWLGMTWQEPVRRQSEHFADYEAAVHQLTEKGLTYPCFCSRKEIQDEVAAAAGAPHDAQFGPDGPLYPGTCRALSGDERSRRMAEETPFSLRLDSARAAALLESEGKLPLTFEAFRGDGPRETRVDPLLFGDIVIARKGTPTSYHVSAVWDDALQGITHVIRGEDLLAATHVQRVLQALWDLPAPLYWHHPLVRDAQGRRLAKRDQDTTLSAFRERGLSAEDVLALARAGVGDAQKKAPPR